MARVRIPAPQVGTAPEQAARPVRVGNGGLEAVAKGVQMAAGAVDRYAQVRQQEEEDAQAIRLQELEGEFTATVQDGLHNSQTGLLAQNGQNASAASVPFYEDLEKKKAKLLEQVTDERAQRILATRLEKLVSSARATGEAHVTKQNEVADDTSFTVLKAQVKDRIATEAFDPSTQAALRGDVPDGKDGVSQFVPYLRAWAKRKGLKPEDAAALEDQWRGESAELVLNRLMSAGKYSQARNLLADPDVQKRLGDKVAGYEAKLTGDEREAEGSTVARGFVKTATNREGRFDLLAAQRELDTFLASDAAPEVKKAAETEFAAASSRAERGWNGRLAEVADRAVTKIVNGGLSLGAAKDERRWLLSHEVEGGKIWQGIKDHIDSLLRQGQPPSPAQQAAMVDFLVSLPGNVQRYAAEPEKFNLEWRGRLSANDLEGAARLVAVQGIAVRKPDETLAPATIAQVTAIGVKQGKWGKKGPQDDAQKMTYYALIQELLQEQARLKQQGGGTVDQTKLLDFARKRLQDGTVYQAGGEKTEGVTAIDASPSVSPGLADGLFISDEDDKRVRTKLQNRGFPSTDEWVRWLYMAEQGVPDEQNPRPARPKVEQPKRVPLRSTGSGAF